MYVLVTFSGTNINASRRFASTNCSLLYLFLCIGRASHIIHEYIASSDVVHRYVKPSAEGKYMLFPLVMAPGRGHCPSSRATETYSRGGNPLSCYVGAIFANMILYCVNVPVSFYESVTTALLTAHEHKITNFA